MFKTRKLFVTIVDSIYGAATVLAALAIVVIWIDGAVIRIVHSALSPTLDKWFDVVSEVSDASVLAAFTLLLFGASRVAKALPVYPRWGVWCELARSRGLLMLLTLATGGLLVLALKHIVARARPSALLEHGYLGLVMPMDGAHFGSFPSSHAFVAFATAAVLADLLPRRRVLLLVLAAVPSICRVLTLEHYPSDVLASALIAYSSMRFWVSRIQTSKYRDSPQRNTTAPG
jgi:membrane-associated phospholipid phosphatase